MRSATINAESSPRDALDRLGLSAITRTIAYVTYELRVMEHLATAGWPVPAAIRSPIDAGGHVWCAFTYLPGRSPAPRFEAGVRVEQRARGRLLARLHTDLANLNGLGQRDGWARAEEMLSPALDELLETLATRRPEEASVLGWHRDRARELFEQVDAAAQPAMIIHGDFAPWNLRYLDGRLSGIYDFEFSHLNHRVADFALSWRRKHDEIVHGYSEVSALSEMERQLLTPVRWAWLLDGARSQLSRDPDSDLTWVMTQIVRRSALMPNKQIS